MKKHTVKKSIPVNEIGAYMNNWQKKKPECVRINVIGKSGGYDIMSAVFTDSRVSDENKQIALVIAQHSGMEISGMTTVMSLGNYLASDKKEAQKLLEKLIIVLVPCPNPYSYSKQSAEYQFRNEAGVDEYVSFGYEGANKGDKNPSATALQQLIDKYKPEILLDCHGVIYENQMVIPSMGYSAFASNRLYSDGLTAQIQKAGTDAGFAVFDNDFCESLVLADRDCTDPYILGHFRASASGAVAPIYAYLKYHTLAASLEIAWEEDGLARVIKALEIGTEKSRAEYYDGYPVRTVKAPNGHNSIRAWGTTAEERRKSRIELWTKRHELIDGVAHPEMPGFTGVIISTSHKKANEIVEKYYAPLNEVFDRMNGIEGVNTANLKDEIKDCYEPYSCISLEGGGEVCIENGMTVRLGIPFKDAVIKRIMYNGNVLREDERDGYTIVKCDNWVFADVHIPPGKTADFAVVTAKYECEIPKSGIIEF